MKSTIRKIHNLESIFNSFETRFGTTVQLELLPDMEESEITREDGLVEHHQGVYKLDGNENYIITGSSVDEIGYFYFVEDGFIIPSNVSEKYLWPIDSALSHPGGIQVADTILAVGNERYNGLRTDSNISHIRFFDVDNPRGTYELSHLCINRKGENKIASAIGLTRLNGQWILAVRAKEEMDFYLLDESINDIRHPESKFRLIGSLNLAFYGFRAHQSINLFFDQFDQIYLIGMSDGSSKHDRCWLYKLNFNRSNNRINGISNAESLSHLHFKREENGPRFKWGSCVHFNEQNKLEMISISAHIDEKVVRTNKWTSNLAAIAPVNQPQLIS